MNRTHSTQAIIISLRPLGENNSSVTLLTPENGITYATLYGGPKSKMKSLVAQFHSGIIYLYDNPEKNQTKISDFDVKNYHQSFSQNLYKSFAAALACELAIKTNCAGSNEECFTLISGFFDGMELCDEEQCKVGLARFLWRFIELLGIQPDASECGSCGKNFLTCEFAPETECYYNSIENNIVCRECSSGENTAALFPLKLEAVRYLAGVTNLTPAEARRLKIDKTSYEQIKNVVFFIIENNINTRLNTIETGMGIL